MRILVTGGTVFISKFVGTYFANKGNDVFLLNRGNHEQIKGTTLIKADRHLLNNCLKKQHFDVILDICAYNKNDIKDIINSGVTYDDYIMISSSAVYPQTLNQPFNERQKVGINRIWGDYGINKIAAEKYLIKYNPYAYILRPPYLYGPMQNLYRESFVFECAEKNRKFYIPKDGKMKLQFYNVEDLCLLIEKILITHPKKHIINVGNTNEVDINTFVELCYKVVGTKLEKVFVSKEFNQRDYFCFYDYEYILDVREQNKILPTQKELYQGLKESYEWYKNHRNEVRKKLYIDFIDKNLYV